MKTIWKTTHRLEDISLATVPAGAVPLCIQMQGVRYGPLEHEVNDIPQIWWIVDDSQSAVVREIAFFGTGDPLPVAASGDNYIGTIQMGRFVFHAFDLTPAEAA